MLRTLLFSDLPELLTIEQATHEAPWTEAMFHTCLQMGCKGWVCEKQGKLVGFIIASLQCDECHILNLCIVAEEQRQGLGRRLLSYVLDVASKQKTTVAYLEVRRTNLPAIKLYESAGFVQIGERKDYYPSTRGKEDALIFAKQLG